MPYSAHRSFTKPLEPSSAAAALLGPVARMPAASNASHSPPTSGGSAPITAKSIFFSFANATKAGKSIAGIGTHSATAAIPALPGAQ